MNKDPGKFTLIIATICVILLNLSNLWEYIATGDPGSIVSNICFIASGICIVIGWIPYMRKKKKD